MAQNLLRLHLPHAGLIEHTCELVPELVRGNKRLPKRVPDLFPVLYPFFLYPFSQSPGICS